MAQKTFITGGIVYFVDHEIGILPEGDVIVDGDTIVDIGLNLADQGAEITDARGMIVTLSLIDTHRHTWQTALRQIGSDWTLNDYVALTIGSLAPKLRAVDIRTGNLLGALEAIDSSVTILMDCSHIINSPDPNGRIALALGGSGPEFESFTQAAADVALAREVAVMASIHVGVGMLAGVRAVSWMDESGLLGDDLIFIHGNMLTDDESTAIARSGGHVSVSPRIEMQIGSLTLGKKADIIVLRPEYTDLTVANDIAGAT